MRCLLPSTDWDDFYDLTTINPIINDYPEAEAGMIFINRDKRPFPYGYAKKLKVQTELMADLKPTPGFDRYIAKKAGFIKPQAIEWFMNYRHDPSVISIKQEGSELWWYAEGPIRQVWFEEIPPMALISTLFFQETGQEPDPNWEKRLREKAEKMQEAGARFADFGTRRSFSPAVHDRAIEILKEYLVNDKGGGFITTSNMHLGCKYDLPPSGTMGHKSFMVTGGINGVQSANRLVMESWQREYHGNLGTFLPDTYTTPVALRDFDSLYARLFDSIRHDSGDPFTFTDMVVAHYRRLKIDPMSKTIIFSDGLNVDKAIEIAKYCKGKINCSFGIGTNITNDVGAKPLNIVIKVDKVRKSPRHPWIPVVKLSDTPGKISGDPEMAAITKRLLGI